ncbi:hypothetical protein G6F40_016321 [Rhizopus arrhizus]|nr:hypothetical protein G6F40_016321 [Rhizopus arrhizus]
MRIFSSLWQCRVGPTPPRRGPTSVPITGTSWWATKARIARASSGGAPVATTTRSPLARCAANTSSACGNSLARICASLRST